MRVERDTVSQLGGSSLLFYYGGSFQRALAALYPGTVESRVLSVGW